MPCPSLSPAPAATAELPVAYLTVEHDEDCECPIQFENTGDRIISFSSRHNNFCHPDSLPYTPAELKKLLSRGLAYWLSYYEHGSCLWQLADGPKIPGSTCPWDSVSRAGLLVLSANCHRLKSKRRELAVDLVAEYTRWCNGECYWYRLADADDEDIDSCGGFIGLDWLKQHITYEWGKQYRIEPATIRTSRRCDLAADLLSL